MNFDVHRSQALRSAALSLSLAFLPCLFLAGCNGGVSQDSQLMPSIGVNRQPAMASSNRGGNLRQEERLIPLTGAAALCYIYEKRQESHSPAGPQGKYYRSNTGRIFYRNQKTEEFQWICPPSQPIKVPATQAEPFREYAGYDNRQTGRGFGGYGPNQPNYEGGEPAVLAS